MPAGSPVIATATVPLNPLTGFTVTLTGAPDVPAMRVCEAGDTVSVKSGGDAEMVTATVIVWVRAPELPVKVSVAAPTAAAEAVMVTLCAEPGISESVVGCAVTPAGSPVIATATVPLNPLTGFTVTLRGAPDVPAMRVCEAGDAVSVKSGGSAEMVAATVIGWVRAPELPVKVSIVGPATAAAAEAVMVTLCAEPGISESVEGCVVTPAGSPVTATATIPIKPLVGTAFTLTCCPAPPESSAIDAGVVESEKSPWGCG
jgi:uncharacterized protein YodC (DUF2158 family)